MAYTPPPKTAADIYFSGSYTAPGKAAVIVSFSDIGPNQSETATGELMTHFGTITLLSPVTVTATGTEFLQSYGLGVGKNIQVQTGLTETAFGSARLFPYHAVGFVATQFGGASTILFHTGAAPSTIFGTPVAAYKGVARGFKRTVVSRAYVSFPQTSMVVGFAATRFGRSSAYSFLGIPNRFTQARGARTTAYGTPVMTGAIVGDTTYIIHTTFGAVRSGYGLAGTGFPTGSFGTPTMRSTYRATGLLASAFGSPVSPYGHLASPVYRNTRWGLARSSKTNDHFAYGWTTGRRFGQPVGASVFPLPTTGIYGTHFGTPVCSRRGRALHIPPLAAFGQTLMIRSL